jgi:uncharacterized Rmd1/YagE family protein
VAVVQHDATLATPSTRWRCLQNDVFTINTLVSRSREKAQAALQMVQLAIAYALAQSIKLSLHEEQVS